jgi:transcriptional regulator with XRE-family HTH domain
MPSIGARIHSARVSIARFRRSQDALAGSIGVARATVNSWENDRAVPRGANLFRLAQVLEVTEEWLLYGDESRREPSEIGEESDPRELQLQAIRRILDGDLPAPAANDAREELDDEALRARFLSAVFDYTDVRVKEASGISIETIRSYRAGKWPSRGLNRKTREGLIRFIDHHENRVTRLRWEDGAMPPLAAAIVLLVEEFEADQAFVERYPNQGAVSLGDSAMGDFRGMGVLTYEDETTWLGFKRGRGYNPSLADSVTMHDIGITLDPFLGDRARDQIMKMEEST